MSKITPKKRDTFIDMTAMSDMTVLLLTFFMLTATFIPLEPVQVITPASVVEIKIPENNVATVIIDPQGRVFLNFDRPADKQAILEKMGESYGISFNDREIKTFMEPTTFASVPMNAMRELLSLDISEQKEFANNFHGVPADSLNNQLASWLRTARSVNRDLSIAIKADRKTPYPMVRNVTSTLQDIKENRFSLVTQLKGMPDL